MVLRWIKRASSIIPQRVEKGWAEERVGESARTYIKDVLLDGISEL